MNPLPPQHQLQQNQANKPKYNNADEFIAEIYNQVFAVSKLKQLQQQADDRKSAFEQRDKLKKLQSDIKPDLAKLKLITGAKAGDQIEGILYPLTQVNIDVAKDVVLKIDTYFKEQIEATAAPDRPLSNLLPNLYKYGGPAAALLSMNPLLLATPTVNMFTENWQAGKKHAYDRMLKFYETNRDRYTFPEVELRLLQWRAFGEAFMNATTFGAYNQIAKDWKDLKENYLGIPSPKKAGALSQLRVQRADAINKNKQNKGVVGYTPEPVPTWREIAVDATTKTIKKAAILPLAGIGAAAQVGFGVPLQILKAAPLINGLAKYAKGKKVESGDKGADTIFNFPGKVQGWIEGAKKYLDRVTKTSDLSVKATAA